MGRKKININIEEYSHKNNSKNTGSAQSQIQFLTTRITSLTAHVNRNSHDNNSILSLKKLVNKKRKLMKYMRRENLKIKDKNIKS